MLGEELADVLDFNGMGSIFFPVSSIDLCLLDGFGFRMRMWWIAHRWFGCC